MGRRQAELFINKCMGYIIDYPEVTEIIAALDERILALDLFELRYLD